MPRQPLIFTYWLLRDPVLSFTLFPNTVILPLVTYPRLSSTCVTYRTQVLSTQPLAREEEDFPRTGKHATDMPLLACLA